MKRFPRRARRVGAEMAVIVVGVLIALWADGLAERYADRADLRSHLVAVRDELVEEATLLEQVMTDLQHELESLRALGALQPLDLPPDSVMGQLVVDGFTNAVSYQASLSALADLESSGLLPRVGRVEVRLAIARLRQELSATETQAQLNLTGPQHDFFDPFVLRELPFIWERLAGYGGLEMQGKPRMDWGPLFTPQGRGFIAMRYDFLATMIDSWRGLQSTYRDVIQLIEAEVG